MTSAEEKVRSVWIDVEAHRGVDGCGILLAFGIGVWGFETPEAAWQAALAFTEDREEQVRQIDEEISEQSCIVYELQRGTIPGNMAAIQRTINRLQRERESAARGMKQQSDSSERGSNGN